MNQLTKDPSQLPDDRLSQALRKADLDPAEHYNSAIKALLAKTTEAELQVVVESLKPTPVETTVVVGPIREQEKFLRFNLSIRLQHATMAISVIILIITGLPLKYHDAAFSQWFMNLIGGIEVSKIAHRIGATGLIFVGAYHLGYIAFTRVGRRDLMLLLPRFKDALDALQMFKYYFGLSQVKAQFGRFSYIEKFDYWAVYWGMVIMISSGSLLWFNQIAMTYLPKFVMDIATVAHRDEALLATLAIVIWHFYNVHLSPGKFPMSKVFINGILTREEMEDEHPLELEEILGKGEKSGASRIGGKK